MPWLLEMTVLVSSIMAPAVLYLSFRFYNISIHYFADYRWLKILLPVLLASFYLFSVSGVLDFYITGQIDVLTYPKPFTYWFWFGLLFVFQLVTLVIIADVIKLSSRFWSGDKDWIAHWHARILLGLFVVVFVFVGWKTYRDTTRIVSDQITLPVENLPESLEQFKLVHISDIQGDEYTGREEIVRYVDEINKQQADLIIFTGDLISYGTDFIKMSAEELGKAKAKYGTIAVVGDHDYWAGTQNVEQALAEQGILLLKDENHTIKIDSMHSTLITGVTEVYSKASNPEIVDSLTADANSSALKIFASHQVVDHLIGNAQKHNYDMMLAGHTHGGQIRVPFMGMSFSAAERETKYVSGLYHEDGLPIHINNGLGFTLGPIRYGAPPTVTVITLESK